MEFPPYSVLIAVYKNDNADYFDFALESMLNQSLKPDQIVIVEDGLLTEELYKVIENKMNEHENLFSIVKLEKNRGLGLALREGIKHCKNEWIFRMDADDYSAPERCKKQFEAAQREHADMIGCDVNEFIGNPENVVAKRVFPEKHEDIYKFGKRRTPFCHPAILMKKSQVLEAGNYQDAYLHEDFDLFVRMLAMGCKGYSLKEPLVSMRVSDDFYSRRGGVAYLKTLLKFNYKQLKRGWMGINDFVMRSAANIVFCLMPNSLRNILYRKVLRK